MSKFQAGRPKIGAADLYKDQPEQARVNLLRDLQVRLDQGKPAADFTKKYGSQFADPNRKPYDYTAAGPNIPFAPTGRMTREGATMNPFSEGSIESRVKQTRLDNEARIRAGLNPRLTREEAREWLELAKIKEEKTWESALENERERSRIPGMFEAEGAESIFAINAANMGGRGPFQSKTERDAWINKQGKFADTFRKMAKDYDKMQKKIKKHGKLSGLQVAKTRSSVLEYLRNDGMGEQSKRGWLMSHTFLTSITPSMVDDLNFQQVVKYARKDDKSFKLDKEGKRIPIRRFRDEAGNLAKLDPETSPVGTTTKQTYLTAGQALDFFRFQIIQGVEEGQYTSMDARTLLNKLEDSMLEKGRLTEDGRKRLIKYFADLEGLGIEEATRIVDDTVDYLTSGKLATAEKTKLTNEKTKLQNLLDIIDKKKPVPSNMTLTNNGQLMWEKDGQGYMVNRDDLVQSLNEVNKDLSPESLKKVQKSFTTLDETILNTLDFKKDKETGKISIDTAGRKKGQIRSIELKLKEIIEQRDKAIEEGRTPNPLPAMLVMEALHPTHTYNPYSVKGILFNPEGFDAGVIGDNPFLGHNSKRSNIRMMIDPMFGVIANAVFEKYLLQTQFVPTAGEAHAAVEAIVKRGILPTRTPKGTDENKLTDTSEKEGMETPPQNEVWVPKIDPETKEPVKRSDGSVVMQFGGVTRLAGSATIGREVFKEWKRWQNYITGKPTDAYDENSVSNSEYEVIGTFIRELWQKTNPDLYKVERFNGKAYYKLTDTGLRALQQAADAAPNAFKAREKKGRTVSRNVVEFETKGKRQVTTVVQTGKIAKQEEARYNYQSVPMKIDTLRNKLIFQIAAPALIAAKNQVTLDSLGDFFDIGPEKFDEFRGTFKRKVAEVRRDNPDMSLKDAENLVWSKEGENYRPEYEMDKQITRFLEFLNTVGRDSDQALYLDVVIQKLTGRMHVDQTRFNPQLKPWMRYAVGGVLHSEFHPNKKTEEHDIFKEEMAKRFIRGAKDLLPKERVARFDQEIESYLVKKDPNSLFAQIYNEGAAVEASLISDEDLRTYNKDFAKVGLATQPTRFEEGTKEAKLNRAAQMSKGFSEGAKTSFDQIMEDEGVGPEYISVPESIGSIPGLDIPESLMARTRGGNNKSEGIEGMQIIEGAIEFKRYMDARKNYKSFRTNLQVEYDGKTHGPASMLALVGALKAAYRIGLLRKPNQPLKLGPIDVKDLAEIDPNLPEDAVNEVAGDLRDAMSAYMKENKDIYAENYTAITGIKNDLNSHLAQALEAATKDREHYLKKPPMVLTYGRLLENLKEEIFEVMFVGDSKEYFQKLLADEKFLAAVEKNKKEPDETEADYVSNFLHTILADAIDTQLHPAVIEFGQLMRANALIAALTDEVMIVKNASGIDQYIGARETVVKRDQDGEVIEGDIYVESGGGKAGNVSANFVLGKSRPAGSALKNGIPGGHGRGRGVPAVAQGIDGDWMMRLYSGDSWKTLSDIPNFWILGVFDAAVTNIASAAEVRRQANKAWKTSVKEFYPWKYTLTVQPKQSYDKLYQRLGFDPQEKKWISEDHANMTIPFIDFQERHGDWPSNVVAPDKSDPSTLPTQVYYQVVDGQRKEIGKFASDLAGPYKLYYYLLHDTSPGESEGDLSIKNLYRAVDDAMIQRGKHGFRPRKGLIKDKNGKVLQKPESYTEYKTEKAKHVKKVVHAMIRMIDKNVPEKQKLNLEAKLLTKDPVTTPLEGMTRKQIKNFADAIEWGLDIFDNNKYYDNVLTKGKDYLFNEVEKKGDDTLQID